MATDSSTLGWQARHLRGPSQILPLSRQEARLRLLCHKDCFLVACCFDGVVGRGIRLNLERTCATSCNITTGRGRAGLSVCGECIGSMDNAGVLLPRGLHTHVGGRFYEQTGAMLNGDLPGGGRGRT